MAQPIIPYSQVPDTYRGLPGIFEFRNDDGDRQRYNCGQAAACTVLTHYDRLPTRSEPERAREVMTGIEGTYPPDNFGGYFGTSRERVTEICLAHGVEVDEVHGEEELRARLDEGLPVMLMVGTETRFWRFRAPAGHWMVAFGYDDEAVFLTNGADSRMPWDEFRGWWGAFVPRLISMDWVGLVARPV